MNRLRSITGGEALLPLAVLFGLNFVDEFDRVAFAALTPEIRDAFNLSDTGIQAVGLVALVVSLLGALPVGIVSDRFHRVRLCVGAAVLWGLCAALTGVVPALWMLVAVRLGSGVGRIINEVVHPSLLGDYYAPEHHAKVFGAHRFANSLGALAGPLAGVIAAAVTGEAAFFVLSVPTALLLAAALRLREPLRGESIDADLAAEAAEAGHVPYGEARRQLFAVPTLRRLWVGAYFLGIGALPVGQLLSLFFEEVYEWDAVGRGTVQFVFGAGEVVGLLVGARFAARVQASGKLAGLATVTGLSFVQFAVGLVLMAAAPWAGLSLFFALFLSIGIGSFQPAYYSLVGLVAPPRVRSQAYAWAILIYGSGGMSYLLLAGIGENGSYRTLTVVLSVIVAIAGIIGATARRSVDRDVAQAQATLSTARDIRAAMEAAGERPLLVCRNVEVAYGQVQILFGVDLDIQQGEIVALLGTNGAGKSTLLKAIAGVVDPIGGAIFFDGRDITHADAVQAAESGIVVVPGGKAVFPTLTVAEHFKAGTWLFTEDDPAVVDRRIQEVLDRFPRLRERWTQMAGNMSGGEQQQLALGMAFVAKPRLLIIDELSLGLSPVIVEQLLDMVRAIHAAGCTIILVEQSVNVALTVASRAYFLEKGEVRFEGATEELLERGDILRSVFLETTTNKRGGARTRKRAAAPVAAPDGPPALEVVDLRKRFGGIVAVDEVSFTVAPGEILGLIGQNGAGKTTIFDLLSGLLASDGGRIWLGGTEVSRLAADRRAALGLGRSFQDARIFPAMTVAENIALSLERHIDVRDHLSSMLLLPALQESEDDIDYTVDHLIELMNLGAFRDKFVAELSTGSRRIVDLAMAIAHNPSVLMLDEPSSGIAQRETEALGPLLKRIQREAGCAMLVIEHDMPLITSVSDRMLALELGRVIAEGTPSEVTADPRVISSYLGGDVAVINRSGVR